MRRTLNLLLVGAACGVLMMASAGIAIAAPDGSSQDGASMYHECFEVADLCQHQVLTPSGHNNSYSYFTPSEQVGSPPAPEQAEVVQRCEEETGVPLERICVHSVRTPSGNILSSLQSRPLE